MMQKKIITGIWIIVVLILCFGSWSPCFAQEETQQVETGNSGREAIFLSPGESRKDSLSREASVRWFKIKVEEDGILQLTFRSTELKQNGMLYLYYGETADMMITSQNERIIYQPSNTMQQAILTSEALLKKGVYLICLRTSADTLMEEAEYEIKADLQSKQYDDIEPNTAEGKEQPLPITNIKKAEQRLNMNVSSNKIMTDTIDKFRITLNGKRCIRLSVKSSGTGTVRIRLYKEGEELKLLNEQETQQYFSPEGKEAEFVYTTPEKVEKGTYLVTVILQNTEPCYMDYSIAASYFEPIVSMKLNAVSIAEGKTKKLSLTLTPSKANESVTYRSSNKKVATVNKNGVVTGVKKGTATITVTSSYGKQSAKCKVTVKEQQVENITLSAKKKTLVIGDTYQLKPKVLPENTTNKKVTYQSSDKKIATVTSKGKVKAIKKGTVTITIKSTDGSKKKAVCKITVKGKPVKSITLAQEKLTLTEGETYQLKSEVLPKDAGNKKLTYKSSDEKVVTVSSKGQIKAIKQGNATITVTAADGSKKKAKCQVTVKRKPVIINPSGDENNGNGGGGGIQETPQPVITGSNNVKVGDSITLTASVAGGSWASNSNKVRLLANGTSCQVTGVEGGSVMVWYTVNGKTAQISIYVKQ